MSRQKAPGELDPDAAATAHLRRLQFLSSDLADVDTPQAIAGTVLSHAMHELGAAYGAVWQCLPSGQLELLTEAGADHAGEPFDTAHPPGAPVVDAVRQRAPIFLTTPAECALRAPARETVRSAVGVAALAAIPVLLGEQALGVIELRFVNARTFPSLERAFLLALAAQGAQALAAARRSAVSPPPVTLARARQAIHARVLARERSRLRALFMRAPALLAILRTPDFVYELVNPLYLQAAGRQRAGELIGASLTEVHPAQDAERRYRWLREVCATGQPFVGNEIMLHFRHPDGTLHEGHYNCVYHPLRDARGAIEGILLHAVDVTEVVRARQGLVELATMLATERERLALAQEAAQIGTFEWNFQTGAATASPELEALYGFPDGGLPTTYDAWLAMVHPADRVPLATAIDQARTGGSLLTSTFRVRWPDGTIHVLEARGRVIFDRHGQPRSLIGVTMDVTERTRAEQAQREHSEALATVNRIGRLLSAELDLKRLAQAVTDAAAELTGAQYGVLVYQLLNLHDDAQLQIAASGLDLDELEIAQREWSPATLRHCFGKQGAVRCMDVIGDGSQPHNSTAPALPVRLPGRSYLAVPIIARSGAILGALCLSHDDPCIFTDRAESIALGLAAQASIAMDNARLYQEAQDSVRVRDEFLSSAAHDLKTPLAAIKGLTQLLLRRATQSDAPETARLVDTLETIDATATRMTDLINDLLDVTRLHLARPLELERVPTSLARIAEQAVRAAEPTTERHRFRLEIDTPELTAYWDAQRLRRVIDNLLTNAIRFSPNGGTITVRVSHEVHDDGDWAVLAIDDEGIGIRPGDLEHVFERFHRGSNVIGRIEGTGVGLASAHYIVKNHGGFITVTSEEGKGSTFVVRLPLTSTSDI